MTDNKTGQAKASPVLWPSAAAAVAGLGFLLAAVLTGRWVFSAFPIGLVFGFVLQKGDLCGASAFSEVLLMRDARKIFGLWTGIVAAMAGFAVFRLLGWITLSPKPLLWINDIGGGLIFGAGTVLAGGCISGCLYKSAMGHINSIGALLTIPLGAAFVEHGPLTAWTAKMKAVQSSAPGGGPVTLPSLTGVPFWAWALIFTAVTGIAVVTRRGKRTASPTRSAAGRAARLRAFLSGPWKPWQAGIAVGLLVVASLFSSAAAGRNYPIGVTHGVLNIHELLTESNLVHVAGPVAKAASQTSLPGARKITWWLVLVVFGTFIGAFASASLSGRIRLRPKPPEQVLAALFGGFLVGSGAAMATGCVVGNIMSGWPLMSIGMFFFGIAVILSNWATTYFFMMGGTLAGIPDTVRMILGRKR